MKTLGRIPSRYVLLATSTLWLVTATGSCDSTDYVGRMRDGSMAGSTGSGGAVAGTGGMTGQGGAVAGTGGTTGKGGAGGSRSDDAAADGYQCPLTNVYCPNGYTTDAYGCTICAGGTGGSAGTTAKGGAGGSGGADGAADAHVCPPLTDIYCARYVVDAYGCTVCAVDGTGGSGGTGSGGNDVGTGGTGGKGGTGGTGTGGAIDSGQDGATACGHTTCGAGEYCCNSACSMCVPLGITGCGPCPPDAAGEADGNGCQADPQVDSQCGGTKPPHFYRCILTMLASPCVILSIGDVTNTFCCP